MNGVLPLTPYVPVCCTHRQIDPFFGSYFEYLDKFNSVYFRILHPVYEGMSLYSPYPCQEIYTNVFKLYCGRVKQFNCPHLASSTNMNFLPQNIFLCSHVLA